MLDVICIFSKGRTVLHLKKKGGGVNFGKKIVLNCDDPSFIYTTSNPSLTKLGVIFTKIIRRYSGFQAAVDTPAGKIFRFVRPVAPRNFWSDSVWKGVERKFRLVRSFAPSRSAPETSDSLARQRRSAGEGRERGDAPRSSRSFGLAPLEPRSSCRTAPHGWMGK